MPIHFLFLFAAIAFKSFSVQLIVALLFGFGIGCLDRNAILFAPIRAIFSSYHSVGLPKKPPDKQQTQRRNQYILFLILIGLILATRLTNSAVMTKADELLTQAVRKHSAIISTWVQKNTDSEGGELNLPLPNQKNQASAKFASSFAQANENQAISTLKRQHY